MTLNRQAIGQTIGPVQRTYAKKDVMLYALGVGAGFSELEYCFEKNLKVIPSFSIAMIFDFLSQVAITSGINLAGVLHGEQELIFHRPLPPEGTLTTSGKIIDYYDKGKAKGALVVFESETTDDRGRKLFTSVVTLFGRLDGGFGGKDRDKPLLAFPDRDPDVVVEATPSPDQPLLYRLSGDIFHLHVDPEFAAMSGFEKPIMHGLCTHGFACRALIASLIPGHPEKVRRLTCRFSKPLYPGVPIRTLIWKTAAGRALWRTVNAENGEVVIDQGEFDYGDLPGDEIRFDDRVAIVTGAGAGLGRAYALALARRGAKVVVNDLGGPRDGSQGGSSAPADRVVAEIRAAGGEAIASYDSVATFEGGANIVKTTLERFGTVDILINNAGILRDKSFAKMEPEAWQAVLDVHLTGAYNVTRHAFPVMKQNGFGRILMTASASGLYGNFGQTNYAAAKMGLVGLMNALKLEGEKYGILVNTIAPVAASRLTRDILPPDLFDRSKPEFVAPLALYLCSDRCRVSGDIYLAGMGYYSRAAVITGPGKMVATDGAPPTPETLMEHLEAIAELSDGKCYRDLMDQMSDQLPIGQPAAPADADRSPAGFASAPAVFAAMPGAFVAEMAVGVKAVFQYIIHGAGTWTCEVDDGTCRISTGAHEHPTCTLTMAETDFLEMINGRLLPMQAFTSGKLQVDGDVMQAQLIETLFKLG